MIIALDKIESGVAYNQADCQVIPSINSYSIYAAAQADATKPISATASDLRMGQNFGTDEGFDHVQQDRLGAQVEKADSARLLDGEMAFPDPGGVGAGL